ncbi:MAG: OmpH family outer membrane protein [Bacteroidota bacterium]
MFKKLVSAFFLLLFVVSTSAFGQLNIGYLNTQEVLSEMPGRAEVESQLDEFVQSKRGELEQRTIAFQDSVASFQQNQENLSEDQIRQQEGKLAEMEAEIQEYQQGLQQQVQQRRSSLLEPLYNKMDEAISAVAEENDLDFVLNEATGSGENVIYYAASEKLDITQQVMEYINDTSDEN